jgi:hypothetical protein
MLAAMLTGAWRHHLLLCEHREDVSKMRQLVRHYDALSSKAITDANNIKRLQAEGRALEALNRAANETAEYYRKEHWKRAAYDPGR